MSRELINLHPSRQADAIEPLLEWEDLEVAAKARQWIEDMKARMNSKEKCDGCEEGGCFGGTGTRFL